MEHANLPNGAACSSGERAAVAFKNLYSFLAHAGSLVPEYNLQVDVNHLRLLSYDNADCLAMKVKNVWVNIGRLPESANSMR
ncbi:hypothetical protein CTI12_AA483240 [Artemisia annua]|uniref:Uncharacterized protein n=1 Tax=Artemisia annua TaxID=35608 RepID=A0A2U1LJP3_ARTAN|nr:hypothetical protein CTI12_AA483240 [Artemisia annua]